MGKRYQVLMEGSGFCVHMGDGNPVTGFLTERRLIASDSLAARERAIENLWKEPKVQHLLKATAQSGGNADSCAIRVKRTSEISWLRWYFSKFMKGFAFYEDFEKKPPD